MDSGNREGREGGSASERKGEVDDRVQLMEYGGHWGGTTPFTKRNEQPCMCVRACFYKELSTARCKPREMLGS